MPSEHSHREHSHRRRASHDEAGASRPPVHISRPIEFGSQQKIRGPDYLKTLDQVRDEQGPDYNPLQRKRSGSVSRAWQAVKRSLSRHGAGQGRRHSFIGLLFGEEEERGRGRHRRESDHGKHHPSFRDSDDGPRARRYISPSNRHSYADSTPLERKRSHRHRSGSRKHSDRHSRHHSPDRHEAKARKSETSKGAALDPRKSVGPPYDSDITSDWYWQEKEGIWAPASVRGALMYEALNDTDYELITGRKRGVFPPKPRGRGRAATKDKSHALDNQVYFDKETSTYRALKVKTTDAARPASKEQTSHSKASKRKSVRGSVAYVQPARERERPTTQWPSVVGGAMDSSSPDDEPTARVTRFPTVTITPTTVLPYNRSSSIYPEDQAQGPASSTAPPVPAVPTRYNDENKTYINPRETKAWQGRAAAGPAPGSVDYIRANFADIAKQNPYMQNTTTVATARPGTVLDSAYLQPPQTAGAGGNNTVWETDYPSTWDTQVPLDLKGKKPVEIPGLEEITNISLKDELQRLSFMEASRKGQGKGKVKGNRSSGKTDTIDGIIDAYAEPLRTRWEGDEDEWGEGGEETFSVRLVV